MVLIWYLSQKVKVELKKIVISSEKIIKTKAKITSFGQKRTIESERKDKWFTSSSRMWKYQYEISEEEIELWGCPEVREQRDLSIGSPSHERTTKEINSSVELHKTLVELQKWSIEPWSMICWPLVVSCWWLIGKQVSQQELCWLLLRMKVLTNLTYLLVKIQNYHQNYQLTHIILISNLKILNIITIIW